MTFDACPIAVAGIGSDRPVREAADSERRVRPDVDIDERRSGAATPSARHRRLRRRSPRREGLGVDVDSDPLVRVGDAQGSLGKTSTPIGLSEGNVD